MLGRRVPVRARMVRVAAIAVAFGFGLLQAAPVAALELIAETGTAGNPPPVTEPPAPPPPPPPPPAAPSTAVTTKPASTAMRSTVARSTAPAAAPEPPPPPVEVAVAAPMPEPVPARPAISPVALVPAKSGGVNPAWLLAVAAAAALVALLAFGDRLRWRVADGWNLPATLRMPAVVDQWRSALDEWRVRYWQPDA